MRQAYAHDAVVRMGPTDDADAIGAAVTVALCGHWEHDPPCPLAPHATRAERNDGQVQVRTLFATEANVEMEVRRRIDRALTSGTQQAPTGETSNWEYLASGPGIVQESERAHGQRLISS
jgi:hypothetical protein